MVRTSKVIHSQLSSSTWVDITPKSAGWRWSGLSVVQLGPGQRHVLETGETEMIVLPLAGSTRALWRGRQGDGDAKLAGRANAFAGPTDFLYLPPKTQAQLGNERGSLLALCRANAEVGECPPARHHPRSSVQITLRGAGNCSRQIANYALGNDVPTGRLLVCEAITPGGNWSSFPPHKHDVDSEVERALEEIYFFMFRPGQESTGLAFQRGYGTPDRPFYLLEEVHHGDVILVPHGYHGPTAAIPEYDLYGLNVMAGANPDGKWLFTDDPKYQWIRESWQNQPVDPRLPL